MFFDKELKRLQIEKSRVALRCELRRRLAPIEMQSIRASTRRSFAVFAGSIAAGKMALELFQELRRFRRRR
ncbi:MAG: hypothetical protein Q4G66_11665 [bacterium]|nr:hypothetical protein [bacterium]